MTNAQDRTYYLYWWPDATSDDDHSWPNESSAFDLTLGEALDLIEEHNDGKTTFELIPE